ncbi:hypothetical protein [Mycoplasma phocimorsus]|uniref:hypothetical protein n=1 Tax=Mycoplasma phocimorsus TaxID=3045839 RepID=UPI0024C0B04F|nr:hypothetical protein [Mycoplasma phocimorsus]MDJ1648775.1 hypothetical protein [Mycoplasma phocimorsus]
MKKKILFFLASASLALTPIIALSCSINKKDEIKKQKKEILNNTTKNITNSTLDTNSNYNNSKELDSKTYNTQINNPTVIVIIYNNPKNLDPNIFVKPNVNIPKKCECIPNEASKLNLIPSSNFVGKEFTNEGITFINNKKLDPKTFIKPIITDPKPFRELKWYEKLNEWVNKNRYKTAAIIIGTVSTLFTLATSISHNFLSK